MTFVVLARLRDERGRNTDYVRVKGTESDDWATVQHRWDLLDMALRKDRVYLVQDDPRHLYLRPFPATLPGMREPVDIAYFAVRDTKDPVIAAKRGPWATTWGEAARSSISLVIADNREARTRGSLERRWGKAHGFHGHAGGWIYRLPCREGEGAVSQGWSSVIPSKAIGIVLRRGGSGYIMPVGVP